MMANLFFKSLSGGPDKAIIPSVLWWLYQTLQDQSEKKIHIVNESEASLAWSTQLLTNPDIAIWTVNIPLGDLNIFLFIC